MADFEVEIRSEDRGEAWIKCKNCTNSSYYSKEYKNRICHFCRKPIPENFLKQVIILNRFM